jgi:hypothetical protein
VALFFSNMSFTMNCRTQQLVSRWTPNTVTVPTQWHSIFSPTQNCLKKVGLVSWPAACLHNDVCGSISNLHQGQRIRLSS